MRPIGRPLLALSDIHGDRAALESILTAVKRVPLAGIVAAGDHCLGGSDPFGVWQRLNEIGATLVRGETDLALATLDVRAFTPKSREDEEKLQEFEHTRSLLGDIVCRRLGDLPVTSVVSLDDRAGVMVVHGSPRDPWSTLTADMSAAELADEVACAAEDVLVVGKSHRSFVRKCGNLLVVNAGSVGRSGEVTAGDRRIAHATLVQEFTDGVVRALTDRIVVARKETRASRSAG